MKKQDKVGRYYDSWHEQYVKFYGTTFQAHRPKDTIELLKYLNIQINFQPGDIALDAGCGVCGPSIFFARNNDIKIEALTNSYKQSVDAIKNIELEKLKQKINVKVGDFHYLNKQYKENYFNRIFFLESFGHATQIKRVLNSANTVLKVNGYIYIKDYFEAEIFGTLKRRFTMYKAIKNMNKFYSYNLPNLYSTIKIARRNGLRLIKIQKPKFILNNEDVVMPFETRNNINIYYNIRNYPSSYLPVIFDPLELVFQKVKLDSSL